MSTTTYEERKRVAHIMASARVGHNKSQEEVSKAVGCSVNTIKNWERGDSLPDIMEMIKYCWAIGINPQQALDCFVYPEMEKFSSSTSDDDVKKVFIEMVEDMSPSEIRGLLFVRSTFNGGSWIAYLQKMLADSQTPLDMRIGVTRLIESNYKTTKAQNRLNRPNNIQPNMQILADAIERAEQSINAGKDTYTLMKGE